MIVNNFFITKCEAEAIIDVFKHTKSLFYEDFVSESIVKKFTELLEEQETQNNSLVGENEDE